MSSSRWLRSPSHGKCSRRFCGSSRNCGRSHHQRQHETFDSHAFKSNRRNEFVRMPRKTARSGSQTPLGRSGPSTLSHLGFQPVQKTPTIHVSSGFIWGIPVMKTKGHDGGARRVEGTGITDLRPLADSLDTYARQIHSIAEIIRSIEEESAEQSTEAKAAENTAPCSLHDGQQHLTSTPVISDTLDRTPVIEAHAAPVVDTISPEAIWQRISGARKTTEARAIEWMPDKVYQDGCAVVGGGELGFEDQRVASAAALDPNFRLPFNSRRGDLPQDLIAIGSAEEKAGQNAQPLVDLADKGDGPESAQHGLRDADMDLAALRLSSGGWRIF